MLSYEDIVIAYTGQRQGLAPRGGLARTDVDDAAARRERSLITWVQEGADRAKYETGIKPMLDKRCMTCHDGSNPHLINLNGYDNLKKVTEKDTGTDIFTLVRVSHIHLFGFTFIFFIARPDLQPCLRAAGVVQVRRRRDCPLSAPCWTSAPGT